MKKYKHDFPEVKPSGFDLLTHPNNLSKTDLIKCVIYLAAQIGCTLDIRSTSKDHHLRFSYTTEAFETYQKECIVYDTKGNIKRRWLNCIQTLDMERNHGLGTSDLTIAFGNIHSHSSLQYDIIQIKAFMKSLQMQPSEVFPIPTRKTNRLRTKVFANISKVVIPVLIGDNIVNTRIVNNRQILDISEEDVATRLAWYTNIDKFINMDPSDQFEEIYRVQKDPKLALQNILDLYALAKVSLEDIENEPVIFDKYIYNVLWECKS